MILTHTKVLEMLMGAQRSIGCWAEVGVQCRVGNIAYDKDKIELYDSLKFNGNTFRISLSQHLILELLLLLPL